MIYFTGPRSENVSKFKQTPQKMRRSKIVYQIYFNNKWKLNLNN